MKRKINVKGLRQTVIGKTSVPVVIGVDMASGGDSTALSVFARAARSNTARCYVTISSMQYLYDNRRREYVFDFNGIWYDIANGTNNMFRRICIVVSEERLYGVNMPEFTDIIGGGLSTALEINVYRCFLPSSFTLPLDRL